VHHERHRTWGARWGGQSCGTCEFKTTGLAANYHQYLGRPTTAEQLEVYEVIASDVTAAVTGRSELETEKNWQIHSI
jgi:hypothetical protein